MPVYQCSIQKLCDGVYWTNRYFVSVEGIQQAVAPMLQIVEAERESTLQYVTFVSARVSVPGPEEPSVYIVRPLQGNGAKTTTSVMPLTVCANVTMNWRNGRPDRKFYRGMLSAADLAQTEKLTAAAVNAIEQGVCAALLDIAALCSETGAPYDAIQCSTKVSQHQLTRGTRKRTTPVIPVPPPS